MCIFPSAFCVSKSFVDSLEYVFFLPCIYNFTYCAGFYLFSFFKLCFSLFEVISHCILLFFSLFKTIFKLKYIFTLFFPPHQSLKIPSFSLSTKLELTSQETKTKTNTSQKTREQDNVCSVGLVSKFFL